MKRRQKLQAPNVVSTRLTTADGDEKGQRHRSKRDEWSQGTQSAVVSQRERERAEGRKGEGVTPSQPPCRLFKGESGPRVCKCVCVCVCERERERERGWEVGGGGGCEWRECV